MKTKRILQKNNIIVLSQTQRAAIDIGKYSLNVRQAEDPKHPNRTGLYDMYAELLTDAHLAAVINKLKSAALAHPIKFMRNGKEDNNISIHLESPWFMRFISDVIDAKVWGFSLLQFYIDKDGFITYDLIPRKHVNPISRLILTRQGDAKGYSFDSFPDMLFVGDPYDLGMMQAASPYVIYKRNAIGDWVQFSELNGQPFIEGVYSGADDNDRMQLIKDIWDRGGAAAFVHQEGTEIKIHDIATKSATSELYHVLCTFCNDEISKIFLGNTLTTQAAERGTQALGTVHKKEEELINKGIGRFVLNVLNYHMRDIFTDLGINTKNGAFEYDIPQSEDLATRIQIDMQLRTMGLPIPHDYLYKKYDIPKPDNYNELIVESKRLASEGLSKEDRGKPKNRLLNFFAKAPAGKTGALDW